MKKFVERRVELKNLWADAQRMNDLALAMILPWRDGVPQFLFENMGEQGVCDWLLDATADEKLPWEIF